MKRIVYSLTLGALVALPALASAQGLVPCNGPDCQTCDILKLIQNLISYAITLGTVISIILIAKTGLDMVIQGSDNPLTHSALRNRLKNITIGFALMLGAFTIVDASMKLFLNDGFLNNQEYGTWKEIKCVPPVQAVDVQVSPGVSTATSTNNRVPTVVPAGSGTCTDCVSLSALGMVCKSSATCTLKPGPAAKLQSLNALVPLRITEAYPPTVAHSNACHASGTCVDATLLSGMDSASTVIAFIQTAANLGIRAVYEGSDCGVRNSIRATLGTSAAFCSADSGYGHITGTHFSLYP